MDAPNLSAFNPATIAVFATLAILSVLAMTVTLFKIIQFSRMGAGKHQNAEIIVDHWLNGRPDEAMRIAANRQTVLARVLEAVFSALRARPNDNDYAEELGRQTALVELATMSRRMRLLEAVVQAAPMLGLLGTVIGMIDAFGVLAATQGAADPALLAGGIWTALMTTAIGLAIALLTFFAATWLESRIDGERQAIETLVSVVIYGRVGASAAGR